MEASGRSTDPDGVAGRGLEIVVFQAQTGQDLSSGHSAKETKSTSVSLVPCATVAGTRRGKLSRAGLDLDDDVPLSSHLMSDNESSAPATPPLHACMGGPGEVKANIFEVTCQVKGCEVRMLRQPTRLLVCK